MKKLIMRMYGVACILFFFLFLYGLSNLRISVDRTDALNDYTEISNYSVSEVNDQNAPLGVKMVIRYRLKEIKEDYNTLIFLTRHQNVKVSVGTQVIYELKGDGHRFCPKSPGVVYNDIVLKEEYSQREMVIELEPLYEEIKSTPSLKMGAKNRIITDILYENLPVIILCGFVILIGIGQLCVAVMNRKREGFEFQPALCHAISIILVGNWKLFESDLFALFGVANPFFAMLSYLIFLMLPIMMNKAIRDQMGAEKTTPWIFADGLALGVIILQCSLQLCGIMDLWRGIWIGRASVMISFLCVALAIHREVYENGWTKNTITGLVVTIFAFIWVLSDVLTYYLAGSVTDAPFSVLLFVIFLVIMIVNRIQISKKGMEEGMQAVQYQKLAFHDALTGFYNRAAFIDYIAGPEFVPDRCVMLAFDLNNLKKCNDELGHDKGDLYIKEASSILMDCFGEGGRCYRLGGDEFSAILNRPDINDCEKRIQLMNERVDLFNRESQDIRMGIAYGYAVYDPVEDEDIHATIRRADKMMYEVKFAMKQKAAETGV